MFKTSRVHVEKYISTIFKVYRVVARTLNKDKRDGKDEDTDHFTNICWII